MQTRALIKYHWVIWFFVFWAGLVALGSLAWPLGFDQGTYAWVGDIICKGGMPYRNAWEVKGPATYALYAACQALFGHNIFGIRILDVILATLAALCARRLLREWVRKIWANVGALFFFFLYFRGGYWNTATSDGYATMLSIAVAALVVRQGALSLRRAAAAGLLAGLAVMIKSTYLVLLFPPLLFMLMQPALPRRKLAQCAAYLGAFSAMCAAWLLLLALRHSLADYIEINDFIRRIYLNVQHRSFSDHLSMIRYFMIYSFLSLFLFSLAGMLLRFKEGQNFKLFCLSWLILGLLAAAVQNKYYSNHFIVIYPPLAFLATLGLAQIQRALPRDGVLAIKFLMALALYLNMPNLNRAAIDSLKQDHRLGREYYDSFDAHVNIRFQTTLDVAQYVRENTRPGDAVQVWGFDNLVYFLSGRRAASRMGFIQPIVQAYDSGNEAELRKYFGEFMAGMRREQPKMILIAENDNNNLIKLNSKDYLEKPAFAEMAEFIKKNYKLRAQKNNYEIWVKMQ